MITKDTKGDTKKKNIYIYIYIVGEYNQGPRSRPRNTVSLKARPRRRNR